MTNHIHVAKFAIKMANASEATAAKRGRKEGMREGREEVGKAGHTFLSAKHGRSENGFSRTLR